jgi:uncharacterized protein (TIGR02646 family)
MIRYRKGPCPPELEAFAATEGADWNGFASKDAVRVSLHRDQRALCAYCQQRIQTDPTTKIEHWIARNHPERGRECELDWRNLLGVCSGVTQAERHCDTKRGDLTAIEQILWLCPVEGWGSDPGRHLRYLRSGVAVPNPDSPPDDRVRIEHDISALNLNAAFLVRNRKAALDALEQRLKQRNFTPAHLRQELADLDRGLLAREHTEVARDYLVRKLRRHGETP